MEIKHSTAEIEMKSTNFDRAKKFMERAVKPCICIRIFRNNRIGYGSQHNLKPAPIFFDKKLKLRLKDDIMCAQWGKSGRRIKTLMCGTGL